MGPAPTHRNQVVEFGVELRGIVHRLGDVGPQAVSEALAQTVQGDSGSRAPCATAFRCRPWSLASPTTVSWGNALIPGRGGGLSVGGLGEARFMALWPLLW